MEPEVKEYKIGALGKESSMYSNSYQSYPRKKYIQTLYIKTHTKFANYLTSQAAGPPMCWSAKLS